MNIAESASIVAIVNAMRLGAGTLRRAADAETRVGASPAGSRTRARIPDQSTPA
jgi:hypothetical protein